MAERDKSHTGLDERSPTQPDSISHKRDCLSSSMRIFFSLKTLYSQGFLYIVRIFKACECGENGKRARFGCWWLYVLRVRFPPLAGDLLIGSRYVKRLPLAFSNPITVRSPSVKNRVLCRWSNSARYNGKCCSLIW